MCTMQHIGEWCTPDELAFANLSQLALMDLHPQILKVTMDQLLQSTHCGKHFWFLIPVYDHCLSLEQMQSLQFIAAESCQCPHSTIPYEVAVEVQCLQLWPVGLGEDGCCVIGELVVGKQELVQIGKRHAGQNTCGTVVYSVAEETEHLQTSPLSLLHVQNAQAVQVIEVQVQFLQFSPCGILQCYRCFTIQSVIAQIDLSQLRQFCFGKCDYASAFDAIIAERQRPQITPISLDKLQHFHISQIAKIQMHQLNIIRFAKQLCHFLDGLHVDHVKLCVQVVVFVEFVDDAIFGVVVGEFETHLPSCLHATQVLQGLINRTLL